MRLNLGSGNIYVDGWVNVDWETPRDVDERVDLAGPLPWEPDSVSRVFAGHLFEHLTPEACSELAKRLLVCMKATGVLVAVGPDIDVADRQVADGTYDYSWGSPTLLRYGAGRWNGDVHLWETTGSKVAELLRNAGWPTVAEVELGRLDESWPVADRGPTWQYAVEARPR